MMLQKAFNYTQEKTYSGIAKSIWNGKFEIFVDLIQFLYSVGTCCGYAIIIANELYLSVSFITEGKVVPASLEFLTRCFSLDFLPVDREWLLVIATLFVILPPSLMRKITALRYTSIVAISGILYITIVVCISQLCLIVRCFTVLSTLQLVVLLKWLIIVVIWVLVLSRQMPLLPTTPDSKSVLSSVRGVSQILSSPR